MPEGEGTWAPPTFDDENELEEEDHYAREAVLFLIEATPSMLEPNLTEQESREIAANKHALATFTKPATSKMEQALRCVYSLIKRKIISSPRDSIGLLIYGTAKGHEMDNLTLSDAELCIKLEAPTVASLRGLQTLLQEAEEDPYMLKNRFAPGESDHQTFLRALGYIITMFRQQVDYKGTNRLFLITDNDNPIWGADEAGSSLKKAFEVTLNKRKDADSGGIDIEPYFLPPTGSAEFNLDTFWGPLITMTTESESEGSTGIPWPVPVKSLADSVGALVEAVRVNDSARRKAFAVPFILRNGFVIGVNAFSLIGKTTKKKPIKIDMNNPAGDEVVKQTIYLNEDDQIRLELSEDVVKYFQVGQQETITVAPSQKAGQDQGAGGNVVSGEAGTGLDVGAEAAAEPKAETIEVKSVKLFFSEEDMRQIKTLGQEPNLRLLGFKPRKHFLRFQETIKHAYFIYPDENAFEGSTRTFASLLKTMVAKDLVGYGSLLPRTSGHHRIVLLLPQDEKRDAAGLLVQGPGIHLVQLPFADELRDLALEETATCLDPDPEAPQPPVDAAKKIIKALTYKRYDPEAFSNPALAYWNECLAALALDEEPSQAIDNTYPRYHFIHDKCQKHIDTLKELVDLTERDLSKIKTSSKRTRAVKEPLDIGSVDRSWIPRFRSDPKKMKNDELKRICRELQLPVGGNKAELIDRIEKALEQYELVPAQPAEDNTAAMDVDGGDDDDEVVIKRSKKDGSERKRKVVLDEVDDPEGWDD